MPAEFDTKATAHALLKELHEEENSTSPRAVTLHDQAFAGKWKQLSADQRRAVEAEMKKQEIGFETVYPSSKVTFNDANGEIDISIKGKTHAAFRDGAAAASTTHPTDSGAAQREAAAKEAARVQAEKEAAAKQEQARLEAESQKLQGSLSRNNSSEFAKEYESLSAKDKVAVAALLKTEAPRNVQVKTNVDGTLASIAGAGGYQYISPGEFETLADAPGKPKVVNEQLTAYYNRLTPDAKQQLATGLDAEATAHSVTISYDKNHNPEIHDAGSGKKVWPDSKLGGFLHNIEKPLNIPH
jgi:hypothetical protein